MPKKDKRNKKAVDDSWEDEIPTAEPFNQPAQALEHEEQEPSEPVAVSAADLNEEFGGGGLLSAIRKNASKKKTKKGGKNPVEQELAAETPAEPAPEVTAPIEVTEIDEDDFGPGKKGKKVQQAKASPDPPPTKGGDEGDEETGDGEIKIKSKKEKEKERKEREKQRKKEQAARKKATEPTKPVAASAAKVEPTQDKSESKPVPPPAPEASNKKKKIPAALAALQKQQELLRQREEERKRQEEEERRQAEEEERLRQEEEKRKEEAKARKKQKEKEKKEQLRKEGKLLTKSQQEAQKRQQLRLKQLIEAGMTVEGLQDPEAKKKKPVYDKKKKSAEKAKQQDGPSEEELVAAKKAEEELLAAEKPGREKEQEEEEKGRLEEESEAPQTPIQDDVIDDWEKAVDSDGNVKENWDDGSEEEGEDSEAKSSSKALSNELPIGKPANSSAKQAPEKRPQEASGTAAKPAAEKPTSQKAVALSKKKLPESEDESDEKPSANKQQIQQKKDEAAIRRQKQLEQAKAAASKDNLRSPICCILGHVDTGKTKLLDKIRQTNVQEGEAGGITQQIGATYFPVEAIKQKTAVVNQDGKFEFKVPGLLVIDTPGHESFTNLRSRGSSLCNIAILVVDIMHGLEPQTIESIQLLRDRKTPFIVALNKIDRLYDWKAVPNNGFQDSYLKQKKTVQAEFQDRLSKTKLAFAEQGFNAELFYENKNMTNYVSLVPTSAHTGEGIPDMLKLLLKLTQERMARKLMYLSEVECTVLEVKVIEGLGTTIDVILSNGILREGDRIVICGLNGAISTNIRALLTPQPLRELRVKSQYVHNKEVKAALGVKIAANDLEQAIAGSRLLVCGPDDDEEDLEMEVMSDLENLLSRVSTTGKGVTVQASTLGSLEALLEFLRVSTIPVSSIGIGPVFKRDVMRAGTMLEKNKEFAVMLCFDVKVDKEAQQYADEAGVKIFTANIIYHLFDSFTAYQKEMLELRRKESAESAVYPCVLNPVSVFNKKDPIVVGVDVVEGSLRLGTPIAAVKSNPVTGEREVISLGRVTSMELNHKAISIVKKGQPSIAVKIEGPNQPLYGRQLEEKDTLYSLISRKTIDTLKEHYRDEVAKEDWALIVQLKKVFNIT